MNGKKSYLSVVVDTVFFAFIFFLAVLTVLNGLMKRPYPIIASAVFSLAFSVLVLGFLLARKRKACEKSKEKENRDLYLLQLAFMQKTEANALMVKAMTNLDKPYRKTRSFFSVTEENCVYFLSQAIDGASKAEIVKLFNYLKDGEKGKILGVDATKDVLSFASRFGGKITVLGGEKTYRFLKDTDALPDVKFFPFAEKKQKLAVKNFLSRKKAVKYMLFGLCFAFMSFIVRYNLYYVIVACAFLIVSLASALFGKSEIPDGTA